MEKCFQDLSMMFPLWFPGFKKLFFSFFSIETLDYRDDLQGRGQWFSKMSCFRSFMDKLKGKVSSSVR